MRFAQDNPLRLRPGLRARLLNPLLFRSKPVRVAGLILVLALAATFAFSTGGPFPLLADQTGTLRDAILRVLARRSLSPGAVWQLATLKESGDWAYAAAVQRTGNLTLPSGPAIVLAHRVNGQWQAAGDDTPAAFNALLNPAPETLLPASTKTLLRLPAAPPVSPASVANVSGYRLPFTLGAFACVVQTDIARTSSCAGSVPGHGYPAVDFDIENGGESGDVVAAKDGVVKFRKDVSIFGSPDPNDWTWANIVVVQSAPSEYVWYMHLLNGSIPYSLQVGSFIKRGQKIGVEGATGWASGVHLHLNVATGYTCCLNPGDPQRIVPYWPGSDYVNMQRVDFDEYRWSVLQQTDIAVSQNASPDCSTPSPNANQVVLYDLRNYCGAYQIFDIGSYPVPFAWGVQNDAASAIKVGANVAAKACVDANFGGVCESFLNNTPDLSTEPIGDNQVSSLVVAVRPPPPAPPALVAPANGITVSEGAPLTLAWSTSGDQSYGEYSSPPTGLVAFGWQNETTRALSNLPPGYTYLWHVKARNLGGESVWSAVRSFAVRPAAPSDLKAAARPCGPIDLTWLGHSSASVGYDLYRDGQLIAQTAAGATSFSDASVSPNTSPQYVVRAVLNGIESDVSNAVSVRSQTCGHFAYLYTSDTAGAASFNALLASRGLAVDLITVTAASGFDFSSARGIIIADDAAGWPSGSASAIGAVGKPVVGLGQGGAAFLGQLGLAIGANTVSGSGSSVRIVDGAQDVWWFPNLLPGAGLLTLYSLNVPYVAAPSGSDGGVVTLGQLADDPTYAPIIAQQANGQCYLLWGWRSSPASLSTAGQMLFLNSLLTQPCGSRLPLFLPWIGN